MGQHHAQPVQIVLVFDDARAFDRRFARLEKIDPKLKKTLKSFGPWTSLKGYNTPNNLGLANDTTHVTIERSDKQMEMGGFANVLGNPLVVNAKTALARAVVEHQRALLIQVGAGAVPDFAQLLQQSGLAETMASELGLACDQDSYEERLFVAQLVGAALIKEMMPSAVHWVQSHQLYDGPTFTKLATKGFSMPLYVGPFIFGAEEMPDGSVKAGLRALGSQHLLGKMVIFKPDVQDWPQSYKQTLAFITYCRSLGRILDNNETMSSDEPGAPVLRVTHKNDIPQLPEGYVELSIDRRPAHEKNPVINSPRAQEADLIAAMRGTYNKMPKSKRKEALPDVSGPTAKMGVLQGLLRRARFM